MNPKWNRLPEYFRCREVPWQIFATLTFRSKRAAVGFGRQMLFSFLRRLAKVQKIHFKKLMFLSKMEGGRSGDHWHIHLLVAGLKRLPPELSALMAALWRRVGGGHCKISEFSLSHDGVGYVLKVPAGYGQRLQLKDDILDIPTLSDSTVAFLRRRNRL